MIKKGKKRRTWNTKATRKKGGTRQENKGRRKEVKIQNRLVDVGSLAAMPETNALQSRGECFGLLVTAGSAEPPPSPQQAHLQRCVAQFQGAALLGASWRTKQNHRNRRVFGAARLEELCNFAAPELSLRANLLDILE